MVTVFVRHAVANYAAWKQVYDGLGPTRQELGVIGASVHRDPGDPNTVVLTHRFADAPTADAFFHNPVLADAMHRGGVVGAPTVWITEDVEATPF